MLGSKDSKAHYCLCIITAEIDPGLTLFRASESDAAADRGSLVPGASVHCCVCCLIGFLGACLADGSAAA